MPYDSPTPPAITDDSFRTWLQTYPPATQYNYTEGKACLIFQYLQDMGHPVNYVTAFGIWHDNEGNEHKASPKIHQAAIQYPHTFGAALKRMQQ